MDTTIDLLTPVVAVVDDKKGEVESILETLDDLNIVNQFFKADDIERNTYPAAPITSVGLIFLDLHYSSGLFHNFDPYASAEWLKRLVTKDQKYYLVIWTRDPDKADELRKVMEKMNLTMPIKMEVTSKEEYRTGDNEYDILKLLKDHGVYPEGEEQTVIKRLYGQVVDLEEDAVIIKCRVLEDPAVFEIRRFGTELFKEHIDLQTGMFLKIRIITRPGSQTIRFYEDKTDRSAMFVKPDIFGDMEDLFLTGK